MAESSTDTVILLIFLDIYRSASLMPYSAGLSSYRYSDEYIDSYRNPNWDQWAGSSDSAVLTS